MKLAVLEDRACIVDGAETIDVEEASGRTFSSDAQKLYERWDDFRAWAATEAKTAKRRPMQSDPRLGPPSPRARQGFGIGVNYSDHASEAKMELPADPMVFSKFVSSIVGPSAPLRVTVPTVDWEVELVVVMGRETHAIAKSEAWSAVAGLTIGQDISDRKLQMAGPNAQFNLGKSRPGYGPIGPWLVTPDELSNPDDLEITCTLNGEVVQKSRTKYLIRGVAELITYLASVLTLYPGDLIFTGTPAGVGFARNPHRYLAPGDRLVSTIEGLGELVTHCVGDKS